MSATRFPWLIYWLALAVILILALAPVAAALFAEYLAGANGCALADGQPPPCLVNGSDLAPLLGNLTMMAWLMLLSVPVGLVALLLWALILLLHRRSRRPA